MITVSVISDIHSERHDFDWGKVLKCGFNNDKKIKVLILAGDIGTLEHLHKLKQVLSIAKTFYNHTIYVPGNHEYDGQSNPREVDQILRKVCNEINATPVENSINGRIHFLNCDKLDVNIGNKRTITILGCTLWTPIPEDTILLRDDNIPFMNARIRNRIFKHHVEWLDTQLSSINNSVIVVTHHSPSYKYLCHPYDPTACYYAAPLDSYIPQVDKWVFGHTHLRVCENFEDSKCTMYNNPVGYTFENLKHKPLTFSI